MADDTQYQGWTNYQTWAVGLWINQDEPMYRYLKLLAHSPQLGIDKDKALREWVEGMNPLTDGSMFSDLLGRAIGRVNWTEIMNAAGAGEGGQGDYHAPGGRSEARPITQIILGGQNRC